MPPTDINNADVESLPVKSVLLLSGPLKIRGISYYGLNLASALSRMGVKVLFFSGEGPLDELAEEMRIENRHLEVIDKTFPSFSDFPLAIENARKAGVEIIHALSPEELGPSIKFAKALRLPVVATYHDYHRPEKARSPKRKYVKLVIAVSEAVREDLVNHLGVPKDIVRVVPTGIDTRHAGKNPHRSIEENRMLSVGTIGEITEEKGTAYFIEAAADLVDRGFDAKFFIVGEGRQKKEMKKNAAEIGLEERIHFLEPRVDSGPVFEALDVFIMPSLKEGLGQIVLEAMAHGVPVIVTGVGGLYSIVKHEQTGLIIPQKDSTAMANAMVRILDDPQFAETLASGALKFVKDEFSMDKIARQTVEIYDECINDLK